MRKQHVVLVILVEGLAKLVRVVVALEAPLLDLALLMGVVQPDLAVAPSHPVLTLLLLLVEVVQMDLVGVV